jgi:hypothetical protein
LKRELTDLVAPVDLEQKSTNVTDSQKLCSGWCSECGIFLVAVANQKDNVGYVVDEDGDVPPCSFNQFVLDRISTRKYEMAESLELSSFKRCVPSDTIPSRFPVLYQSLNAMLGESGRSSSNRAGSVTGDLHRTWVSRLLTVMEGYLVWRTSLRFFCKSL